MNRYTQEQIDAADSIDLVAYAQSRGYELEREGNQYKMKDHDSLYMKGNRWYWFSHQMGGKAISFLTQYEGMGFVDAMKTLLGEKGIDDHPLPKASETEAKEAAPFELPVPNENNKAAYAYLCQRGISKNLISKYMKEGLIYQTNTFVYTDENGERAEKRCPPQVVFVGKDIITEIELYGKLEKVDIRPVSIKKVIVRKHDVDEQNLYFDVILDCVLLKDETKRHIEMVVDAYFDLDEALGTVHTRCACPTWKNFNRKAMLPDNLVPVITKKELDAFAVRMINALYPRASEYAVPISVNQVTRKLGLTVLDAQLDSDGDILGKIFFEDASTIITDPVSGIMHIIPVSAGTILVNTPAGKILDERIRNNTILHECVHWILHRPAFLLAKLWNQECSAIACRRQATSTHQVWTDMDRMEWQANALAPRMLMPDWATRFIAGGWLRRYEKLSPLLQMEKTIDLLSHHFNVSRQLAKIRMEELGYEEAKAAFTFYDRQRHTISFENAIRELSRNKSFRDTLQTGFYAYVDNRFVIRDRKFIDRDERGTLHLSSYAQAHMEECCLSFAARHVYRSMQYGMLRYRVEDEVFITGTGFPAKELAKKSKALTSILQSLPLSFSETLIAHMKRKGITVEQLAENCLMSNSKITRIRRDYYSSVSLRNVVSLCIGLKLHPSLSMDLIHKAGYCFNSSYEHMAYQTLLLCMTNSSIYECNEYLSQMNIPPFGREE